MLIVLLIIYLIQFEITSAACVPVSCDHGKCKAGTCECYAGWEGIFCTNLTVCSQDCHSGLCVNNTCICIDGWFGQKCDKENNCPVSCISGICKESVCYCQTGWTGEACEVENNCPNTCVNGICSGDTCMCENGWTGEVCEIEVSDSETSILFIVIGSILTAFSASVGIKGYLQRRETKGQLEETKEQLRALLEKESSEFSLVINNDANDTNDSESSDNSDSPTVLSAIRKGSVRYTLSRSSSFNSPRAINIQTSDDD